MPVLRCPHREIPANFTRRYQGPATEILDVVNLGVGSMTDEQPDNRTVEQALETLRILLDGVVHFALTYSEEMGQEPADGSIAAKQLRTKLQAGSLSWGPRELRDTLFYGRLLLEAAEDHIRSLRNVCTPPVPALGPGAVARMILEVSGRAWWLLDPSLHPRHRVARFFNELLSDARQMELAMPPELRSSPGQEWSDRIVAGAEDRGFNIRRSKSGRPIDIEEARPSATILVTQLMQAATWDVGELYYRLFSTGVHGGYTTITTQLSGQNYRPRKPPLSELGSGISSSPIAIRVALAGYFTAFESWVLLHGWDQTLWTSWRDHAQTMVEEIVHRPVWN